MDRVWIKKYNDPNDSKIYLIGAVIDTYDEAENFKTIYGNF